MEVSLNIGFLILSLVAGISVYLRLPAPLYLRLFPVFLLMSGILQAIGIWMATNHKSNIALYNINSVFEFFFFLYVLKEVITSRLIKKIVYWVMLTYPVFALINIIFIQKINNWHSTSYSIGSLLVVVLSIYYFFELFKLPKFVNLIREPAFYICSGLLFFYCCSFPFFGLINFMQNMPEIVIQNLGSILTFLNILLHVLFAIAFLCRYYLPKPRL